jgi:hypothetical protein
MAEIQAYIRELQGRAAKEQDQAERELNPLFKRKEGRPPRDFVDSSFLYIRSCDGDVGSRPVPCPAFWLSPDVRVAPLSNLGAPTRQLDAGTSYRFSAIVRNRGDLPVPSAKVEFWLVTPSLGFDTRYATKLGVAADRVQAYGSTEISIDWMVPPSVSGHRCLFARVFSFSPLDIPIDDFALSPVNDRHIAQLNLDIVGQGTTYAMDWVHRRNARERLEIVPMAPQTIKALRNEAVAGLTLAEPWVWKELGGKVGFEVEAEKGVETRWTDGGLELEATDGKEPSLDEELRLTKRLTEALRALEGGADHREFRGLFREWRAMHRRSARTRVTMELPDLGLGRDEAVALNVVRRSAVTGDVLGGIGLFVVG